MYVQRMAPKGVSCVLEIVEDPSFGSLLSFGLAGTATELLGDRAFRVVPVSDHDAAALVRAPRAAPLLDGYRGAEPTDLAAMEDLVRRIGALAEDLPEVRALALDPVLATPARGVGDRRAGGARTTPATRRHRPAQDALTGVRSREGRQLTAAASLSSERSRSSCETSGKSFSNCGSFTPVHS